MSVAYTQAVSCIPVNDVLPPPYSFLSRPPQQKKRPTKALPALPTGTPPSPPRRRSNTVTAIANWAQHVRPGSPAPHSPRSSVSSSRRPSVTRGRRPSIASIRLASGSFLNILDTPSTQKATPSIRDFKADLTAVGYTSVFVQLADSAALPTMSRNASTAITDKTNTYSHIPIPPIPTSPTKNSRTLKRFRSLSILRTRPRSKSTTTPPKVKPTKSKASVKPSTVVNHKKAKYANLRPAPLANELALMQFADGGHIDSHIKRVMEAQAQAAGNIGVGDVYRDGQGGIWWDAEEEWEYAHLLGGEEWVGVEEWVEFRDDKKASAEAAADEVRRGSVSTISTQDSGLDVRDVVQPVEEHDDLTTLGSAVSPMSLQRPGMSVLSQPKRMRKSEYVDIAFPPSPASPISNVGSCPSPTVAKPKGKARRRPAPLNLSPPIPALKCPHNSALDPEVVRKDFLENSFVPSPPISSLSPPIRGRQQTRKGSGDSTSSGTTINMARRAVARKTSIMNVKAFFRSAKKVGT